MCLVEPVPAAPEQMVVFAGVLCGIMQVPPVVTHTKLGTLYEEPCIVYFKVTSKT
jgi:hypothetical protein